MAIVKNGLGHRPFGAWAVEEDKLEEEAAEQSRKVRGEQKATSDGRTNQGELT
jgi:hypothetical protein